MPGRLVAYGGKILYPAMFSLNGIPKAAALPALVMSGVLFARWRRERRTERQALCLMLWV